MPRVSIIWLEGRSVEQKREIARGITKVISEVANVDNEAVSICFHDLPKTNWAKGGKLFLDR